MWQNGGSQFTGSSGFHVRATLHCQPRTEQREVAGSYIKRRFSCEEDRQSDTRITENQSITTTQSTTPPSLLGNAVSELLTCRLGASPGLNSAAPQRRTQCPSPLCCFYLEVTRDAPPDGPPGPTERSCRLRTRINSPVSKEGQVTFFSYSMTDRYSDNWTNSQTLGRRGVEGGK